MGVDLVMICHTCKTVNMPGNRYMLNPSLAGELPTFSELRLVASDIEGMLDIGHTGVYGVVAFMRLVANWLEVHEQHNIWVTNDNATDFFDGADYTEENTDRPWPVYKYGEIGRLLIKPQNS